MWYSDFEDIIVMSYDERFSQVGGLTFYDAETIDIIMTIELDDLV